MFKQLIQQLFGEDNSKQEASDYTEQRTRLRSTYKGASASYNYAKVNHSIAGAIRVGHGDQSLGKAAVKEEARVLEIARATGFTPVFAESSNDQHGFGGTNNFKFWMRGGAVEDDVQNYRAS